jgi:glycosyltransferase involved in cell wall biosynthesis
MGSWIILTGEYPPQLGGVSAYTRNIAAALAAAGDRVDVWAPAPTAELAQDPGVTAHALPDHFGPRSLVLLERELARRPCAHLLVQYVPHAFGMRAMNLPFALWLAARRRPLWVMFHEVAAPIGRGVPLRHNFIGAIQHAMAAIVAARAERVFVSTVSWNYYLRRIAPRSKEPISLPIPSNVPSTVAAGEIERARARLGLLPTDVVVGSFGTYGMGVADLLTASLAPLLRQDRRRVALLVGRGGVELAARAFDGGAEKPRVVATGELDLPAVAAHLAACTAVLVPYPDGVSARRTSAMAALALGVPVITNDGHLTEPLWRASGAVALASSPTAEEIVAAAEGVLADPSQRAALGARGRELYRTTFSLERVVRTLRGAEP